MPVQRQLGHRPASPLFNAAQSADSLAHPHFSADVGSPPYSPVSITVVRRVDVGVSLHRRRAPLSASGRQRDHSDFSACVDHSATVLTRFEHNHFQPRWDGIALLVALALSLPLTTHVTHVPSGPSIKGLPTLLIMILLSRSSSGLSVISCDRNFGPRLALTQSSFDRRLRTNFPGPAFI
jgi:hypothetical protein